MRIHAGAYPSTDTDGVTMNLDTGKPLLLSELVPQVSTSAVTQALFPQFKERVTSTMDEHPEMDNSTKKLSGRWTGRMFIFSATTACRTPTKRTRAILGIRFPGMN